MWSTTRDENDKLTSVRVANRTPPTLRQLDRGLQRPAVGGPRGGSGWAALGLEMRQ
jgi:hypothetical protein